MYSFLFLCTYRVEAIIFEKNFFKMNRGNNFGLKQFVLIFIKYVTSTLTLRIGNQNLYLLCCCREWEDQTPQMTAMWCQNMPVFIQMKLRYTNDIYSIYKVSLPENFHLVIGLTFMIICWSCNVNCIYDELLIL